MVVKERMDLLELLRKRGVDGDVDFLREALRVLVEEIMEAEVSSRIGAGYGERSSERVTQRNGYRSRAWDTRVGTMELQIPKLREGSYFPRLLEPRRASSAGCDPAGLLWNAYRQGGWTTWSRRWGARVSQRARCPVSAPSWTRWWRTSWVGRWTADHIPTCGWTY